MKSEGLKYPIGSVRFFSMCESERKKNPSLHKIKVALCKYD